MLRKELEALTREELVARAEAAGIARPRSLTTAELLDELVLRGEGAGDRRSRGWFGRARDLLKSAITRGIDRPEPAASAPRAPSRSWPPAPPPPLPTVTLAEIYAAQGHLERAVQVLDEVLAKEPQHAEAARLRADYAARLDRVVARPEPSGAAAEGGTPAADAGEGDARPQGAAAAAPDAAAKPAAAADVVEVAEEEEDGDEELDLDEIVVVAVDPTTLFAYWEVRAEAVARARIDAPSGALTLRTVSIAAGTAAPIASVRDDRVDALDGEVYLRGLAAGAHVRASIGWLSDEGYVPLAVAPDVTMPRGAPALEIARTASEWRAPPQVARARPPRFVGLSASGGAPGLADPPAAAATAWGRAGGGPDGAPARRTILLAPAEVFDVAGPQVPIGVWRPPGSSELALLLGPTGLRGARLGPLGGASEGVLGGASELLARRG